MMKSPKRSPEEWAETVRRFRESGLTQRAFAAREGLTPCTVWYWVSKLSTKAVAKKRVDFVRVEACEEPPGRLRVALGGAVVVHFETMPTPVYLAQLARALEC